MNRRISARQKLAIGIRDIHFHKQRSRGGVDGVGVPDNSAAEEPPRVCIDCQRYRSPVHRCPGIYLGYGDENTNGMKRSHVKEFPGGWVSARRGSADGSAAGAGGRASRDQRAYVSITGRDDSVEGSVHFFERL